MRSRRRRRRRAHALKVAHAQQTVSGQFFVARRRQRKKTNVAKGSRRARMAVSAHLHLRRRRRRVDGGDNVHLIAPLVVDETLDALVGGATIHFRISNKRFDKFHDSYDSGRIVSDLRLILPSVVMLITVHIQDKSAYTYRMFKDLWSKCTVECQICFDRITNDGLVAITDYKTLNIDKMFHSACLRRWQRERTTDPFNRKVKFYFNFPPKDVDECESLLAQMKGFIGDEDVDRRFAVEYERINAAELDVEIDLDGLLCYD
ncbi:hypothetical protein [Alphabaculovirus myunipunctae]|uniref:Ac53 n=1 Tax=Mythimna unipuncta nucleopolyhedrovirus TaxID=447897 RepID=A0A2K9VSF3_9ABAC|nr:hypothetical protein [Mythimna unipuncta nucleopolyhedrovirus]AUV65383.1 hypothetical protein [Mythimna unipuncta nucleopolyhedrovirus]